MNKMPFEDKESLPRAFERHLLEQELDSNKLDDLLLLQESIVGHDENIQPKMKVALYAKLLAGMAVFCLALTGVIFTAQWNVQNNNFKAIAGEVVKNHLKLKPLETQATSIDAAREYFNALDFYLINTKVNEIVGGANSLQLIGGRYCSIQGVTAAQLRYRQGAKSQTTQHDLSTLYEVAYIPEKHGDIPALNKNGAPKVIAYKGFNVSFWQKGGVLFVFVAGAVEG